MVMRQGDGPQLTGLPTQCPRVQKDEARGTSTMQLRHFSALSIQTDGITCYKSEYHPPPPPHHHLEESRTSTQRKGVAKSSPATDTPNSTAERRNWIRRPHSSCRLDFRCGGDREGVIKLVSFSRAIHVSQCMGPSVFGLARLFSGVVPSYFTLSRWTIFAEASLIKPQSRSLRPIAEFKAVLYSLSLFRCR